MCLVLSARGSLQAGLVLLNTALTSALGQPGFEGQNVQRMLAVMLGGQAEGCADAGLWCSQDVTAGVQSSARAITAAEQGVRQRASWVQAAVTQLLIPEVKSRAPAVRGGI